ncbi:actin binding protein, partial [Coemansia biformis]
HPASSLHRARSPTYGAGAPHQPAYSPGPASPMHEPERADPARVPAYRSQQEERQSELEALRRSSRAHSSASADRGAVLTHPSSPSSSRIGFQAPGEPSAKVSQADQTKGELEMLRSRRLLNSGLDASTVAAEKTAASERKAELDALRRARSGSQNAFNAAPVSPPVHSWNQGQGQDQQRQQDEDERRRRESEQRQREEDERRRQENEQRQREEDERRRWDQERQREDAERKRDQERERQAEMERQRVASAAAPQKELLSREPRARALYDYDQQTEDELGFKEGDIIYNVDQLDPGWWAGESEDGLRQGMFPSNFVEMLVAKDEPAPAAAAPPPPPAPPLPHPPVAPPLPAAPAAPPLPPPPVPGAAAAQAQQDLGANHAIALFEYEATEDGELSFNEGDQIAHIELVSSDWWEGVNTTTGMQGLFPANHVELQ